MFLWGSYPRINGRKTVRYKQSSARSVTARLTPKCRSWSQDLFLSLRDARTPTGILHAGEPLQGSPTIHPPICVSVLEPLRAWPVAGRIETTSKSIKRCNFRTSGITHQRSFALRVSTSPSMKRIAICIDFSHAEWHDPASQQISFSEV